MIFLRMVPMVLIMMGIFIISHQPGDRIALPMIINIDKVLHVFAYGVLAVSMLWALKPHCNKRSAKKIALITICACTLYGISDELHQSLIPMRQASFYDVVADVIGALIVSSLWLLWVKKRTNESSGISIVTDN